MLVVTKCLAAWGMSIGLFMLGLFLIFTIKYRKDKTCVKFGILHTLFGAIIAAIGTIWVFCF